MYRKINQYFLWTLLLCCPVSVISQNIPVEFSIDLSRNAADSAPIPSPSSNAFELRGIKGFFWKPAQYLEEIPVLKSYGMNFLATCYGSFFRDYAFEEGHNDWWIEMNDGLKQEWRQVVQLCQQNGIHFCFGINPMLYSSQPLDTDRKEDFDRLLSLYRWFQDQGVKWFYIALDDLHLHKGMGVDGKGQSLFANKLYKALLQRDPSCKMIFCPTWYWGSTMKKPDRKAYLEEVAESLRKDILVFWTGNDVVSTKVTVADAVAYRQVIGHELILWDNYPVNDFHNTLNLGPVTGREPELSGVILGIMGNPMRDNRMTRLPLFTMADYMCNPAAYNPDQSIVRAIKTIVADKSGQEALRSLILLYPGDLAYGYTSTKHSVIRKEFERLQGSDKAAARKLMDGLVRTLSQFEKAFPGTYDDTKKVVYNDVEWMKEQISKQ